MPLFLGLVTVAYVENLYNFTEKRGSWEKHSSENVNIWYANVCQLAGIIKCSEYLSPEGCWGLKESGHSHGSDKGLLLTPWYTQKAASVTSERNKAEDVSLANETLRGWGQRVQK